MDRTTTSATCRHYAPGDHLPEHVHERASFCMLLGGSYVEMRGKRSHEIRSGDVLLCPAGVPHAQRIAGRGARKLILFPAGDLQLLINDLAATPNKFAVARLPFRSDGIRLAAELDRPDPFTPLVVESAGLELAAHFCRVLQAPSSAKLVADVCALLADGTVAPDIRSLANQFGVTATQLVRVFRAETGRSLGQYARSIRLHRASVRLEESKVPLAEIAVELGFFDQSHFTRAFRREFGITPARYRRLH